MRYVRYLALPVVAVVVGGALLVGGSPADASDGADIVSLTSCAGTPMMLGSSGPCVLSLQHSLAAVGISLVEDGQFGPQTEAAVRGFQSGQPGLATDGVAGPATVTALDRAANSPQAGPPPGSGTVSGQPPEGTVLDTGVYNCGNLFGTCTFYFSRSVTSGINQLLNDSDASLSGDLSASAICRQVGASASGRAGLGCEFIGMFGKWALSKAAAQAASESGCLELKFLSDPMVPIGASADNGRNCIT